MVVVGKGRGAGGAYLRWTICDYSLKCVYPGGWVVFLLLSSLPREISFPRQGSPCTREKGLSLIDVVATTSLLRCPGFRCALLRHLNQAQRCP